MSKETTNKAVVGRWFNEFWGREVNLAVIDEIGAPDMLLKYSLHAPRRGRDDGRIVEEIGLDDGVTALSQLGLIDINGPAIHLHPYRIHDSLPSQPH